MCQSVAENLRTRSQWAFDSLDHRGIAEGAHWSDRGVPRILQRFIGFIDSLEACWRMDARPMVHVVSGWWARPICPSRDS